MIGWRTVARVALVAAAVLVILGVVLDRTLVAGSADPGGARSALLIGLGIAFLVAVVVAAVVGASASRRVERLATSVRRAAEAMEAPGPAGDAHDAARLTAALDRMAAEVGGRLEDLRRERQGLEDILSTMSEAVLLVAPDDAVVYANPAARRVLGGPAASLRAAAPHQLRRMVGDARGGHGTVESEFEIGFPVRLIAATARPIARDVLLVLRDVTAARRVEAMRRDFVADASHELKTPAASIRAAAETLDRALADDREAAAAFAARLRADAERLSRIVSDLLDLSRLEAERPELEPARLDRLVGDEVERMRPQAREARITLERHLQSATVLGSPKDLALLARNLIDNAVRYTPAGGRVRVDVAVEDGRASLTVTDTGIGIPSRDLPRVFERFYRVDRARSRETGGTGLGLSIARHVVERHGGGIEASSELGRGSTFRVTLPLAPGTA